MIIHVQTVLLSQRKFLKSLDVRLELETPVFDKRLYATVLNKEEKIKHIHFKPLFLDREKVYILIYCLNFDK